MDGLRSVMDLIFLQESRLKFGTRSQLRAVLPQILKPCNFKIEFYFSPFLLLNRRKLIVFEIIVRVHLNDLIFRRSTQNFNYFNQLVHCALTYEQRLSIDHLCDYTTSRPNIYLIRVIGCSEYQFRSSIASKICIN